MRLQILHKLPLLINQLAAIVQNYTANSIGCKLKIEAISAMRKEKKYGN